ESGIPVDEPDSHAVTPLLRACYSNNMMLIRLLIEKGADVFQTSANGFSPVHYACAHNQKQLVEFFLNQGLDVNARTPTQGAVTMGSYLDFVEKAQDLSSDSLFNLSSSYTSGGESLLHIAVKNGHLYMVELLLGKGADVNIQDESENTPLHYAASNGSKDIVALLIKNGADV